MRRQIWQKPIRRWLALLAMPVLAFLLWRWNVGHVNAATPPLDIYPKFTNRLNWYFGPLSQRLEIGNWLELLRRLIFDVANPVGTLLLAWGVWGWIRGQRPALRTFFESWTLGVAAYILIFFNLNWAHSYYQIPLAAIVALFIAACLDTFMHMRQPYGPITASILLALLASGTLWYANAAYYRIDWRVVEAGRVIHEHTAEDDLVVAYLYDDNFEYSDPRLLYSARRHGWSIRPHDITLERLALYAREGGRFLAVVQVNAGDQPPPPWLRRELDEQPFPLTHSGRSLGTLYLYDLSPLRAAP
jgi:hypothetical protein